jgi:DNA-binding NtrC family response regulator
MPSVAEVRDKLKGWLRREPKVVVPHTILVVDSNTNDRRTAAGCVTRLGYEALEATSIANALRQLETHDPQCVLLAFDLADASGLEGLDQIRKLDPNLPVIMLAPSYHDRRPAEAMRRGALAYLAKPFGHDDLRELLPRH